MSVSAGHIGPVTAPAVGSAGRRRTKLVQGDAATLRSPPGSPEPRLSLADVQALQANPTPAARVALAAKFGRQYDDLVTSRTRPLAEAVLELLVKDLERKVRQSLAEAVAASPNLPSQIAARLARDHIDVARPILERSPVLGDDELAEIVRTHAMQYALAVAGREQLSAQLCDVLADTGEAEVVARMIGNAGARIAAETLRRVAEDYREDGIVRQRLIRRPALPYELVEQLIAEIGERLEWQLVSERRMSAEEARQLVAATRDRATLGIVAREHGEHSIERELRHQLTIGELGPEEILGFLRDGEVARVEAGLALLAEIDLRQARRCLYGMDRRGLAALCARAGFGAPHYLMLRMALDLAEHSVKGSGQRTFPSETLHFIQEQYERIRADTDLINGFLSGRAN